MKIDGYSSKVDFTTHSMSTSTVDKVVKPSEQLKSTEQQLDKHQRIRKDEELNEEVQRKEAEHIVNGMNEFLKPKLTNISFELHEKLDSYYVEVVDQDTKEVVKEIPAKKILDMRAKMMEYLGLFIDEKL